MDGILIVDKPVGLTSAEVVRRVKRQLRVKVGHLGTLDPFATGVLPLCLGEATKIAQFLNSADKRYDGLIRLGAATDSGDRTGTVVRTAPVPALDAARLREVEQRFTGSYRQMPPMYSAIKREGVPLYKLARRGIEVEREERIVHIEALSLRAEGSSELHFDVTCSKGTYVRVLGEDIGAALGSAAHLQSLRRTRFGPFDLAQAADLATWEPGSSVGLVSIRGALSHLPACVLTEEAAHAARQGQAWVLDQLEFESSADAAMLFDPEQQVAAIVVRQAGRWAFGRVLRGGASFTTETPYVKHRR